MLIFGITILALSRSRVGREELKKQLVAQFNQEFYGQMDIEKLDGNLLYSLYAKNVVIKSPNGKKTITVDSLALHPDWFSLMDNTLQIDKAELFNPQLLNYRNKNGKWSIDDIFKSKKAPTTPSGKRLDISSAEIKIINGKIDFQNPYNKPKAVENGDIFDFTNLKIQNLYLTSSIESSKNRFFADIIELKGFLPQQDFNLNALQAQFQVANNRLSINGLQLKSTASSLSLFGEIEGVKHLKRFNLSELNKSQFNIGIQEVRLNPVEVKKLFPKLQIPEFNLSANLIGNPNKLRINRLLYTQNQSKIQGNLQAKITQKQIDFDVSLLENILFATDLAFWLPKTNLEPYTKLGKVALTSNVNGFYNLKEKKISTNGNLQIQNQILGQLQGNIRLEDIKKPVYSFEGDLKEFSLDALAIKGISGVLNGNINLNGVGIAKNDRTILAKVTLNNSRFNKLDFSDLNADVKLLNEQLTGNFNTQTADGDLAATGSINLSQPNAQVDVALDANRLNLKRLLPNENRIQQINGKINLKGNGNSLNDFIGEADTDVQIRSIYGDINLKSKILKQNTATRWQDFNGEADVDMRLVSENGNAKVKGKIVKTAANPQVDLGADLSNFNLAKFFPKQPQTRLNGRFSVQGKGEDLRHFSGDARINLLNSSITLEGRAAKIPDLISFIDVTKNGEKEDIGLELSSEMADIRLNTQLASALIEDLSTHWRKAFERTYQQETGKFLYPTTTTILPDWTNDLLKSEDLRLKFKGQQKESFNAKGFIELKKPEMLVAFLPKINGLFPFLAHFDGELSPEKLKLEAEISSDSLKQSGISAKGVSLNLSTQSDYKTLLSQPLKLFSSLKVNQLNVAGQEAYNVGADIDFFNKLGTIVVHSDSLKGLGAVDFAANFALQEAFNKLTIQSFILQTQKERWEIPQNQSIAFYKDAFVFQDIFVDRHDNNPRVPVYTVKAAGILSQNPNDAVTISAQEVELRDVSELLNTKPKFSGLFTGNIRITDGLTKPKITGEANINAFSLKDKHLPEFMNIGDISLDIVGNPENRESLNLKLLLRQPRKPEPLFVSENEIMVTGDVELPLGKNADGSPNQGNINLNANIDRLDLFFFKMLFPGEIDKPTGYGYGGAKISGNFAKPIFDADLQIAKGEFTIPVFNLKPTIAGKITVDKEGFHLNQMRLKDPTNGTALINGDILFNDYRFFSFNLLGEMDKFEIINVEQSKTLDFYGHIWASGNMSLVGPLDHTVLSAPNVVTTSNSQLFIPIYGGSVSRDETFVVFADSLGNIPQRRNRTNLLGNRPLGERTFLDGLEMKMNILAPQGSKVNLVFDELLDDMIEASGNGNIKMDYLNGEFKLFGKFNVSGGDYLFTVQDFGIRRPFKLDAGGLMEWSGDPINARLNIPASYPRRVSTNGLPGSQNEFLDLIVRMNISGEVNSPLVNLKLEIDKKNGQFATATERRFETELNRPERSSVYATSVLLSDSFTPASALLTQSSFTLGDTQQVVYNSLFQLASNFINKVLNQLTPNVDVNVGVSQQYQTQGTDRISDLGLSLGVAWRIFDDKVVLKGQGIVDNSTSGTSQDNNQLSFAANYKIGTNLSTEVFYRDDNSTQTANPFRGKTIGASLLYDKTFSSWHYFFVKKDSTGVRE